MSSCIKKLKIFFFKLYLEINTWPQPGNQANQPGVSLFAIGPLGPRANTVSLAVMPGKAVAGMFSTFYYMFMRTSSCRHDVNYVITDAEGHARADMSACEG